ncbi:hypothetical protein L226DRAFT_565165 [Lentinus tigrinus ALCF2SS1-7]|uniref:uncharacterized protein n=1 Tax=Lentinus tigrinus ALCF2SS1-7 TaxID=1328758 RepID=UPI0011660B72|nr:hypothetical protein L226DRAFT_565165 [Lentinus tigrinus ALCF2SS1-7]
MFTLPHGPTSDVAAAKEGMESLPMAEHSEVLSGLLSIISGIALPPLNDIDFVESMLDAADKYQMPLPIAVFRAAALPTFLQKHPIRVYAIACRMLWEADTKAAATCTLRLDIMAPEHRQDMARLDIPHFMKLMALHNKRRKQIDKALDTFTVTTTPFQMMPLHHPGSQCSLRLRGGFTASTSVLVVVQACVEQRTVEFPIRADPSMEVLPPDSPIRQIYPEDLFENGSYAPLLHGRVVLIHGVSTPSVSWKAIGPYLAAKGFRVLIYDLFGKGYSEAPHMPSDATLFVTQLALLMQYVRWEAAHIVGFSMGGGVAAAFTASLPHLVAGKTLLIASAGLIETGPTPTSVSSKVALLQYQDLRELQSSELPGYKRSLASCFTDISNSGFF